MKEKGFNEYCPLWYNLDKPIEGSFFYKEIGWYGHNSYDYNGKRIVSAPTLQMAMKWLRKEHNIVCNIDIESRNFYYYSIFIIRSRIEAQYQLVSQKPYFETYEEAAEAAIKYCLENLI